MVEKPKNGDMKLERSISYVLITGVILSLILELTGMILYFKRTGSLALSEDPSFFIQGRSFFQLIVDLASGGSQEIMGLRLMTLGIIVLVLTPYARTLMSFIYFVIKRDITYAVFTFFVLVVLTISLAFH